jgi:two-component system cell cycle response regulator DivK
MTTSSASAARPTVLIVDDYRDATEMYAAYLSQAGFRPLEACDGQEALRLASEEMPHVILMDLGLPGMDGFEVTRRLKSNPRTRHIPVVALTAHGGLLRIEDLVAGGFDDLIMKPCLPDVLAGELERFVTRGPGSEEAVTGAS